MKTVEFLKEMLGLCGQTQSHVCSSVGISQSTLSHVLSGRSEPRLGSFIALGKPLGYQVKVETKDSVMLLGIKSSKVDFTDELMRRKETRLERMASYYSTQLSPRDADELCSFIDSWVKVREEQQKKRLAKAG